MSNSNASKQLPPESFSSSDPVTAEGTIGSAPTTDGGGIQLAVETPEDGDDEKAHSFRKRRLSLTNLRQVTTDDDKPALQQQQELPPKEEEEEQFGMASFFDQHQQQQQQHDEKQAEDDEKAHSFRKRRLSLTHKREDASSLGSNEEQQQQQQDESGNGNSEEDVNDGEVAFVPLNDDDGTGGTSEPPTKRVRRGSADSIDTLDSDGNRLPRLQSRILHAGELLVSGVESTASEVPAGAAAAAGVGDGTAAAAYRDGRSGSFDLTQPIPKLYQQAAPPQQQSQLALLDSHDYGVQGSPRWKKRHTKHGKDDKALPFPRNIVGTFSCHGVEPIYDSDDYNDGNDDDDDDDYYDEDDDTGMPSSLKLPTGMKTFPVGGTAQTKPTMAAKINQDRGGVAFPYGNSRKTALFAVYDGHGQGGELVSQYALHEVQRRLEKHPDFKVDIEKAFKETFMKVDASLQDECLIEPMYAGTTACVGLLRDKKLVLSNAGDSRAVLAKKATAVDGDGGVPRWDTVQLTVDQNPDLPGEQARIESMGGFVSPPPEPGLSARVWLDAECTQIGLAMARSIGDHAVKEVGVIAEPVVTFYDIQDEDEFLILATDGVWEFVSSAEAVEVVAKNLHKGATKACRALIETAADRWHDEEGDYRDDITAVVIRLKHLWTESTTESSNPSA